MNKRMYNKDSELWFNVSNKKWVNDITDRLFKEMKYFFIIYSKKVVNT